jgi:hypothetical protein
VEFGFVLYFSGGPEFIAGMWELVRGVLSPISGIYAF